jgi:prolyl 4-hydroxylase
MERSTIVNSQSGARDIIPHRTSDGTFFKRGEDDFILSIEKRLAALMNEPFEHGEGIQVLNYKVGGEYRPHYDYFPPEQPGSKVHTGESGQRVATLIVYLNDVPSGGETIFPQAGVSVLPKLGNGVYFKYMNSRQQLDSMSLHGGEPVRQGEKWIITKWVRERPFV